MATVIRLRREGTRNAPFYRVVAADKRTAPSGKFLELLGTYNPTKKGDIQCSLKLERVDYWISKGALPTETVRSLIKHTRKNTPVPAPAA
jgi:small subunit ribosomal protein S16